MKMLIALLLLPLTALAAPTKLTSVGGNVSFLALTKPAAIKIRGTGKPATSDIQIDGQKATGTFAFELASLDTEMPTRNDHMKNKYLHTDKFPEAKLEITELTLKSPFKSGETVIEEAPFTGNLTLHGVTNPVSGTFTVKKAGDVTSAFRIKLSDFKIEQPSFMGVTVKDDIEVTVTLAQLKEVK